eukprot:scaffold11777_cov99-Isochrysis_galbana.AAC.1
MVFFPVACNSFVTLNEDPPKAADFRKDGLGVVRAPGLQVHRGRTRTGAQVIAIDWGYTCHTNNTPGLGDTKLSLCSQDCKGLLWPHWNGEDPHGVGGEPGLLPMGSRARGLVSGLFGPASLCNGRISWSTTPWETPPPNRPIPHGPWKL